MMRPSTRAFLAALSALAFNPSAAAEVEAPPPTAERRPDDTREPSEALSAWASLRAGVVHAHYPSPTLGELSSQGGQARLLTFGVAARVAKDMWLGARAAYVFAGVEQPAGSYRTSSVWGNPILFALLSRPDLSSTPGSKSHGGLSLSVGLPVASERGSPYEQLDRRALAIGDALEGLQSPETFTPDVFPVALGGSLVIPRQYYQLRLGLELPLLVRLSNEATLEGASSAAIGFIPNGEVFGTAWPWRWFGVSLGGSVAWPLAQPVYLSSRRGMAQLMLTPRLLFALPADLLLALDVAVAAGGPASGTLSAALSARLAL